MNPYHQGQLDFFCAIYAYINAMRLMFGIQLTQARSILATALEEISAHPELWQAMLQNRTDHHWVVPYLVGRFSMSGSMRVRVATLPEQSIPMQMLNQEGLPELLGLKKPEQINLEALAQAPLYTDAMQFGPAGPANAARLGNDSGPNWKMAELWPLLQHWLPSRGFFGKFGNSHKQTHCLILRFHRFLPYSQGPVVSHWSTGREFQKDTLLLYDCTANKEATHTMAAPELALRPDELNQKRGLALELGSLYFLEKI